MSLITPTRIDANRTERLMTVRWNDGHESLFPFDLLRAACPCAACMGGHEKMRSEPDPAVFERHLEESPETRIQQVEAVGSYGMTITWEDGHHYGIYNWHYLRKLCPCPACRQAG